MHTPGPWVVESGKPLMVVAEKGGMAVVVSDAIGIGKVTQTDRANAALIAAAPDLLEALKALLHHEGDFKCGISDKLYDQAENAIAKAESI